MNYGDIGTLTIASTHDFLHVYYSCVAWYKWIPYLQTDNEVQQQSSNTACHLTGMITAWLTASAKTDFLDNAPVKSDIKNGRYSPLITKVVYDRFLCGESFLDKN